MTNPVDLQALQQRAAELLSKITPWPWVDATGPVKLGVLPARERYEAMVLR